jgi:hypothetical protein
MTEQTPTPAQRLKFFRVELRRRYQLRAVSGHRSLAEIERYTARADQAGLARSAIAKLPDKDT